MNILSAVGLGLVLGLIASTPIFTFSFFINKRLDKMIQNLEELNSKYQI
jgi:hypothetical protein